MAKQPISEAANHANEAVKDFYEHKADFNAVVGTHDVNPTVSAFDMFPDGEDMNGWSEAWEEIWKPKPGDTLMGVITEMKVFTRGSFDSEAIRYVVVDSNGELFSFVPGQVFDTVVQEKGITVGYRVLITYKGKKEAVSGNTMNTWGLKFKPPTYPDKIVPDMSKPKA